MRENYLHGLLNQFHGRCAQLEAKMGGMNHVLQEIIGKELLRAQALHKVLMDKGLFTDAELKAALEKLIAESKADLEKMEAEAKAAKEKAVELLVPQGANLTPPADPATPVAPDAPPAPTEPPKTEDTDVNPTTPA